MASQEPSVVILIMAVSLDITIAYIMNSLLLFMQVLRHQKKLNPLPF